MRELYTMKKSCCNGLGYIIVARMANASDGISSAAEAPITPAELVVIVVVVTSVSVDFVATSALPAALESASSGAPEANCGGGGRFAPEAPYAPCGGGGRFAPDAPEAPCGGGGGGPLPVAPD